MANDLPLLSSCSVPCYLDAAVLPGQRTMFDRIGGEFVKRHRQDLCLLTRNE